MIRLQDASKPSVVYKYTQEGLIDWRKMIPHEFLVFDHQRESEIVELYGKPLEQLDKSQVDDKYLLILLGGIKYVLRLRGYIAVNQKVDYVSLEKAVSTCTIQFCANGELGLPAQTYSDTASASLENTSRFGRIYLEAIAANRAFVRCVRNYLCINIVSEDEVAFNGKNKDNKSDYESSYNPNEPYAILEQKLIQKAYNFESAKKWVIESRIKLRSEPEKWTKFSDIPRLDCYSIISALA